MAGNVGKYMSIANGPVAASNVKLSNIDLLMPPGWGWLLLCAVVFESSVTTASRIGSDKNLRAFLEVLTH